MPPTLRRVLCTLLLLACLCPPHAASTDEPELDEGVERVLAQLERFRTESDFIDSTWTLDVGSKPLDTTLSGPRKTPTFLVTQHPELAHLFPILACYLACDRYATRLQDLGLSIEPRSTRLIPTPDGPFKLLVGRASEPLSVELELDRDHYTPHALRFRNEAGQLIEIRSHRDTLDAWREHQLTLTLDGLSLLTLKHHDR